jgi:hypothetical protein
MGAILSKARQTNKMAIALLDGRSLEEFEKTLLNWSSQKQAHVFMEYQRPERTIRHIPDNDRVFPLETVSLNSFSFENQSNLDTAIIHTGPYANELAMRMNALAIVLGRDIFFRNGAYRPETEEGRKVLAHELTHVTQYGEERITDDASREELEREAELVEGQSEYDPDPYEPYPIDNKVYYLRRSRIEVVTRLAADGVERWLSEQKQIRAEKEYLKMLCSYSEWLNEGA